MKKPPKIRVTLLSILAVVIIIVGLFGVKMYLDRPQDLGPELDYIGKRHTGCPLPLPLGYILLCSAEPGEEYYFGTHLDRTTLQDYFTNAQFLNDRPRLYPSIERELEKHELSYKTTDTQIFVIFFYLHTGGIRKFADLSDSEGMNIISMSSEDYEIAKAALGQK